MRKKRRIMSGLLALCIALSVLPLSACTAPKLTLDPEELYALPELLAELWRVLAVEAVLSVQKHGESKLANACKLRDEATAFCAGRQASLGDWLAQVEAVRESKAKATTANLDA